MKYSLYSFAAMVTLGAIAFVSGCGSAYSPLNPYPYEVAANPKPAGLIDDWEDLNGITEMGQTTSSEGDTLGMGTTFNSAFDAAGSDLPTGTPIGSMRFWGDVGPQIAPWPYTDIFLPLGLAFDIDAWAPTGFIHFSYKANAASLGEPHFIRISHAPATDYCWYEYNFTMNADGLWHEIDLGLPDNAAASPKMAACSWGAPPLWPVAKLNLSSIIFLPAGSGAIEDFDFLIDDVYFY
jgi:hypothetical protein